MCWHPQTFLSGDSTLTEEPLQSSKNSSQGRDTVSRLPHEKCEPLCSNGMKLSSLYRKKCHPFRPIIMKVNVISKNLYMINN